jgi:hypothetical protein
MCHDCFGTGDTGGLMRKMRVLRTEVYRDKVTYHLGMKVVEVPSAADVWQPIWNSYGYVQGCRPTAWASAVCKWHPDVVGIVPVDRKPIREEGGWEWHSLPDFLNVPEMKETFSTEAEAITVLSRNIVKWVHSFAQDEFRCGARPEG